MSTPKRGAAEAIAAAQRAGHDIEALKKDFYVVHMYGLLMIKRKHDASEIYSLEEFKARLGGCMTVAEIVLFFHD
jgi:hypothetical protein